MTLAGALLLTWEPCWFGSGWPMGWAVGYQLSCIDIVCSLTGGEYDAPGIAGNETKDTYTLGAEGDHLVHSGLLRSLWLCVVFQSSWLFVRAELTSFDSWMRGGRCASEEHSSKESIAP